MKAINWSLIPFFVLGVIGNSTNGDPLPGIDTLPEVLSFLAVVAAPATALWAIYKPEESRMRTVALVLNTVAAVSLGASLLLTTGQGVAIVGIAFFAVPFTLNVVLFLTKARVAP